MSIETAEIVEICEQLNEAKRAEVREFARLLLTRNSSVSRREELDRWLGKAVGAAKSGLTTDQIMALTRGES